MVFLSRIYTRSGDQGETGLGDGSRVQKDHPGFLWLSFNKLRKTGASLVQQVASDDVASMYLCHGQTSPDSLMEVYTNRPFPKVFEALDQVRHILDPVFGRVTAPFPAETPKSGPVVSLGTRKQIIQLRAEGLQLKEIAERTGTSESTVKRHLRRSVGE